MRAYIWMFGTAVLVACTPLDEESFDDEGEAEDEVASVEQAIDRGQAVVFEEWADVKAIEFHSPSMYQQSLDVLVGAGVDCLNESVERTGSHCLEVDEKQAEAVLCDDHDILTCSGPRDCMDTVVGRYCMIDCCVDFLFEFCVSEGITMPH